MEASVFLAPMDDDGKSVLIVRIMADSVEIETDSGTSFRVDKDHFEFFLNDIKKAKRFVERS